MEECIEEEQCQKITECEIMIRKVGRLLIALCNDVMQTDNLTGAYYGHTLADDVNKLLGTQC